MSTLFISDLHLDATRPEVTRLFLDFLRTRAPDAEHLYILGDLFEMWVGDDDHSPLNLEVAEALKQLSQTTPVSYMHGNRDFLLGTDYAERAGMTLLADPTAIELHGRRILLSHGDILCTDDTAYQAFRAQVRNPVWQAQFLAQPLDVRLAFAAQARAASAAHQSGLANMETITDVNPDAADAFMAEHRIHRLIHGHTHRPAIHTDRGYERIVLGDWYEQGSVLTVNEDGTTLEALPI